jgi:hypothetical protein
MPWRYPRRGQVNRRSVPRPDRRTGVMSSGLMYPAQSCPLLYGERMTTCVMVRRVRGTDTLGVASTR